MKKTGINILLATAAALTAACGTSVPAEYSDAGREPSLKPDYSSLDIPRNIAPLTFRVLDDADGYVSHFRSDKDSEGFVLGGQSPAIPVSRWHSLLADADTVYVDIYTQRSGQWTRFRTVANAVKDSIDPYIAYRLIEPSYIGFEEMSISQRCLENFDETEILNNTALSTETTGQCINCHSFHDYNRDGSIQMHVRVGFGGTVIGRNGELKKINLKTPETVSSGVYPSWHPDGTLIAYSTNTTTQRFHTRSTNKVEVQDASSDLILYDVDADRTSFISNDSLRLESFPYWHPDGKSLWYVSATVPPLSEHDMKLFQALQYQDFHYDLCRRTFDPATKTFGPEEVLVDAAADSISITLPRPSPDGRYVVFTRGRYGTFHIWHRDADLWMLDTTDGSMRPLDEVNSDNVESYHSWSSNGKWMIFSTRRDDGSYTRLYLTRLGEDGRFSKPFIIPQATADADHRRFKSYNIPEFMVRPVEFSKKELIDAIEKDAVNVPMEH
ncbi:MAG: hypothetical protein K2J38_06485 [Muribaculaceae bacterium]|nr:hypothetical protein [Muribaculaceae bacterium]